MYIAEYVHVHADVDRNLVYKGVHITVHVVASASVIAGDCPERGGHH